MDRRAFISGITGGLLATPLPAEAQKVGKVWRIGVLGFAPATADMVGPDPKNEYVNALLRGLRELGYVHGQHYVTEPRGAQGRAERYPNLVADLLRLKVDVIVAVPASLPALKQATSTIPIVMTGASDPVAQGLVQSLGRPGGNFTGLSNQEVDLLGKRLELLKQLVPTTRPVGIVWDRSGPLVWPLAQAAARERGWKLRSLEIQDTDDFERVFRAASAARVGAVLLLTGLIFRHARRVTEVAAQSGVPAMYSFRLFVELGGLMSYAADLIDVWRRTAAFVDKILKGARPGDLPVEQPTKIDLVINLKTAKALGLTIPPSLLQRADQVIE
jgi:putative tryptophan/tyrosine transport system substrate-binding protein